MHEQLIATARGYIGTRFHHQGRLKKTASHKGGIDCLGLLVCIARELDLRGRNGQPMSHFDEVDYSHQPDTQALQRKLSEVLYLLPGVTPRPGDIVLLEIDGASQHLGIVSALGGGLGLIHAYAPARAVVEHALDTYWREKIRSVYRLISSSF